MKSEAVYYDRKIDLKRHTDEGSDQVREVTSLPSHTVVAKMGLHQTQTSRGPWLSQIHLNDAKKTIPTLNTSAYPRQSNTPQLDTAGRSSCRRPLQQRKHSAQTQSERQIHPKHKEIAWK